MQLRTIRTLKVNDGSKSILSIECGVAPPPPMRGRWVGWFSPSSPRGRPADEARAMSLHLEGRHPSGFQQEVAKTFLACSRRPRGVTLGPWSQTPTPWNDLVGAGGYGPTGPRCREMRAMSPSRKSFRTMEVSQWTMLIHAPLRHLLRSCRSSARSCSGPWPHSHTLRTCARIRLSPPRPY